MMPRLDGFELLQNFRRRGFTLPVLMLTANQSFEAKRTGFSSGTDDYMTKPVNYEELLWRIQALLRRARISSSNGSRSAGSSWIHPTYAISRESLSMELPKGNSSCSSSSCPILAGYSPRTSCWTRSGLHDGERRGYRQDPYQQAAQQDQGLRRTFHRRRQGHRIQG